MYYIKNEQTPRERIFPFLSDYESKDELKRSRLFMLDVISKITELMNEELVFDDIVRKSKIVQLDELSRELELISVSDEYLKQFTEDDGRFTEEARNTPEIMIKWIAHDLLKIIKSISEIITITGVRGQIGEFSDIKKVNDDSVAGVIKGEDLTPQVAKFLGIQQSLTFYLNVLDAEK